MNIILILLLFFILLIALWALLGKSDSRGPDKEDAPERIFRKRATDQEIEKHFPDRGDHPRRRKSDYDSVEPAEDIDEEFKLPYKVDEIIPETSRFRIYRRTLMNSEIYARKKDFHTAISLYEGVNSRINDSNTNQKIEVNIDYLKKYREYLERVKRPEMPQHFGDKKSSEIKLSVDGPMRIPERIQIGVIPQIPRLDDQIDVNRIVDEITQRISEKLHLEGKSDEFSKELQMLKERIESIATKTDTLSRKEESDPSLLPHRDQIGQLKDQIEQIRSNLFDLGESVREGGNISDGFSQIGDLKNQISNINTMMNRLSDSMHAADPEAPAERSDISDLKNDITVLTNRISAIDDSIKIGSTDKSPKPTESRAQRPAPATVDTKMGVKRAEKTPQMRTAETGKAPSPDLRKQPAQIVPTEERRVTHGKEIDENEIQKIEIVEHEEEPQDEEEEFELLSEHQKRETEYDEEYLADEYTDDDIFRMILHDDKSKGLGDIEILGDKKSESEYSYDLTDDEFESKQREEEEFYSKFLKHERRMKRELPILKVTYDFSRLPDEFSLSRDTNILEYSFYKYKPLLEKANDFIKKRLIRDAINYYKVVLSQNIPPEFKAMVRKNINDLVEYLEKYFTSA